MPDTDHKRMLEMAAKAAGYEIDEHARNGSAWAWVYPADSKPDGDGDYPIFKWGPLTNDGDALRLAAVLHLIVGNYETFCSVGGTYSPNGYEVPTETVVWLHEVGGDRMAATRLAITRAAAAIGEQMP